jgi:hypothetical protein
LSLFLRHNCRLVAASSPTCCGIIANLHLRSQALATSLSSVSCCFLESSARPLQGRSCDFIADFHLRSQALATSLSSYNIIVDHCGTHANLWQTATFPLLWNLAASFDNAVRDPDLSLFLRHNCRLVAASSRTCCGIIADLHLRSQALGTSLSSVSCCFLESSVRPLQGRSCDFIADFHLRSQALATSLSSYNIIVVHCGTHADLWLTATFPLLWDLAASL